MPTQIFPFDNPANYTFDSNKILISGGKAQLKLTDSSGNDFEEDFSNDTGFTYDPSLAEFVGGQVQQVDKRPTDATFYASYETDEDADWSDGDPSGSLAGGASVSGGELICSGFDGKYCTYDAISNADFAQTICIRMRFKTGYSGNPASNNFIISINEDNNSVKTMIQIVHLASGGTILLQCYNDAGVAIFNALLPAWSPVAGITYEFEFNMDITAGASRLFIDGVQHGVTITSTGTRDTTNISAIKLGINHDGTGLNDNLYNDVLIFDSVQHTSNYTPDWSNIYETIYRETDVILPEMEYTGPGTLIAVTNFVTSYGGLPRITLQIGRSGNWLYWNGAQWTISNDTYAQANDPATFAANATSLPVVGEIYGQFKIYFDNTNTQMSFNNLLITLTAQVYPIDNPTVEMNTRWYIDDLEAFTESATKSGSDEIKYILKKGSLWYYWDGSDWVVSDGTYSQANTAAQIELYKALFTSIKVYFGIKAFLHSENGQTTPELDTLTIQYSFAGDAPDTIDKCIVWGTQVDAQGIASTSDILIELIDRAVKYKTNTMIDREIITITPDSTGFWEVELIENENMTGNQGYKFTIDAKNYYKVIPDEPNRAFWDLTDWS